MLFLSGTTKTWYGGTDDTGGLNRKLCRRTSVPTFSEVLYMQILHNHNYLLINCYVTKYTKALFAGVEQQHNTFNFAFVPQNKVTHSLHVYTSTECKDCQPFVTQDQDNEEFNKQISTWPGITAMGKCFEHTGHWPISAGWYCVSTGSSCDTTVLPELGHCDVTLPRTDVTTVAAKVASSSP